MRVALGAGQGSLMRLYIVESLLLGTIGGLLGLFIGYLALDALLSIMPKGLPRAEGVSLDFRAMGFSLGLALACGLFSGIVPAWRAARGAVASAVKDGGRTTGGVHRIWARQFLAMAQIALSALLLAGAALLAKSFFLMNQVPLGFDQQNITAVQINLSWDTENTKLQSFYKQVLEAFSAIPGVTTAGLVDRLPLQGETQSGRKLFVEGMTLSPDQEGLKISQRAVSPGYFTALAIPLKAGRVLRERASQDGPQEVMVNETLARKYFPNGQAVGHRLSFDLAPQPGKRIRWFEVVGVVGDVRLRPDQTGPTAELFLLMRDTFWPMGNFVLRSQHPITAESVRQAVARVDPTQTVNRISTLVQEVEGAKKEPRVRLYLLGAFALTGLLLAAIGLYGVLSSDVLNRTQEIGIRLTLGAEPARILRQVAGRGLIVAITGLVFGLGGALLLSSLLQSMLYGIQPNDWQAYAGAGLLLMLVAMAACLLPAWRASRLDPMTALRKS